MSDLSTLDQSFALPPAGLPAGLMALAEAPLSRDLQVHEVSFRQLRPHEIPAILHLRHQIALPTAALADGSFATREKKETRSASSAPSSVSVNT